MLDVFLAIPGDFKPHLLGQILQCHVPACFRLLLWATVKLLSTGITAPTSSYEQTLVLNEVRRCVCEDALEFDRPLRGPYLPRAVSGSIWIVVNTAVVGTDINVGSFYLIPKPHYDRPLGVLRVV